jgi:hypothetical protein
MQQKISDRSFPMSEGSQTAPASFFLVPYTFYCVPDLSQCQRVRMSSKRMNKVDRFDLYHWFQFSLRRPLRSCLIT